jgi:hypothetical protein
MKLIQNQPQSSIQWYTAPPFGPALRMRRQRAGAIG